MTIRAAIYARYSSDKQNAQSAEDQLRLCRERAGREGWDVVAEFTDLAISGTVRARDGLEQLLAGVAEYDVVLVEALDRVSRDQEDIAGIYKRLTFAGVRLVTLSDGDVNEMHIGLKGTMSALFVKDLGDKVRRGQVGRVAAGRIPGGLSYGYERVVALDARGEPERGLRAIREDQADIVRRIFRMFCDGIGAQRIAAILNTEGVPGPTGGEWRTNAIVGSRARGNGIIFNHLYEGRIAYNRQRFVKDPATRKRVSRLNPPELWRWQDVPALRIIPAPLWGEAQAAIRVFTTNGKRPANRPKRLLSGLARCGVCGGSFIVTGAERWGCARHRDSGTCSNGRTIFTSQLEGKVLDALAVDMLEPEYVEAYIDEFRKTLEERRRGDRKHRTMLERQHGALERKLARLVDAIGAGVDIVEVRGALQTASAERDLVARKIADLAARDAVVTLHPNLAEQYRYRIATLQQSLNRDGEHDQGARNTLRSLIEAIVLHPKHEGRGLSIEVHGRLATILALAANRKAPAEAGADRMLAMVAGVGFEPTTFRL